MVRYRKTILAILLLSWAAALVMTHLPPQRVPDFEVGDKTLHRIGFAALTILFLLTLISFGRRRAWRVGLTLAALPAYAAIDELTQPWFRRTCDVRDWLADMTGMIVALAVIEILVVLGQRRAGSRNDEFRMTNDERMTNDKCRMK